MVDTSNSSIMGKAYEYACIISFKNAIAPHREVEILETSSVLIAKKRFYEEVSDDERQQMLASAKVAIDEILTLEPRLTHDQSGKIFLSLQPDNVAVEGDVRDVLLTPEGKLWELGVSVKHNHEALKHSRLSAHVDFGDSWFGIPVSANYFQSIDPIFEQLNRLKTSRTQWNEIEDKHTSVYEPVLKAFVEELMSLYQIHGENVTRGLVDYLLGSGGYDYYKLIHRSNHEVVIVPFNLHGTLNTPVGAVAPRVSIGAFSPPTRILNLDFKKNSSTTVIMDMDNGWSISFRIHNASSMVEPSLKFDIQLIATPADLVKIQLNWH